MTRELTFILFILFTISTEDGFLGDKVDAIKGASPLLVVVLGLKASLELYAVFDIRH
jgi:hypothetical protein